MPLLESIAVIPPRRGRSHTKSSPSVFENANDSLPMQAALARTNRRPGAQRRHLYRVGEQLRISGGGHSAQRTAGSCKVLAILPDEGRGALLYRVRNENESFDRIVAEGDLAAREGNL
jgi:hypothetical protein